MSLMSFCSPIGGDALRSIIDEESFSMQSRKFEKLFQVLEARIGNEPALYVELAEMFLDCIFNRLLEQGKRVLAARIFLSRYPGLAGKFHGRYPLLWWPLFFGSGGHFQLADVLIAFGANTNVMFTWRMETFTLGISSTLLREAVNRGRLDVFEYLVQNGANMSLRENGFSASEALSQSIAESRLAIMYSVVNQSFVGANQLDDSAEMIENTKRRIQQLEEMVWLAQRADTVLKAGLIFQVVMPKIVERQQLVFKMVQRQMLNGGEFLTRRYRDQGLTANAREPCFEAWWKEQLAKSVVLQESTDQAIEEPDEKQQ